MAAAIRPEVALLVAEPRAEGVVVFSPGGPLTRSELELVEGPGDPLALGGSVARPPGRGGRPLGGRGRRRRASLSAYDTLAANKVEATLEAVDAGAARVRVRGEVRGSVLGGEGVDGLRRLVHVRPQGGADRLPDAQPRRDPAAGGRRGGAGRQEHADRHPPRGRDPRRALRRRTGAARARRRPGARAAGPVRARRALLAGARPRLAHLLGRPPRDRLEAGRARAGSWPSATSRSGRTRAGGGTRTRTSSATTSARGWARGSASSSASARSTATRPAGSVTRSASRGVKATSGSSGTTT